MKEIYNLIFMIMMIMNNFGKDATKLFSCKVIDSFSMLHKKVYI